jgi:hypothetical protein
MRKERLWDHLNDSTKQKMIDEWVQQKVDEEKEEQNARKSN